MQTDNQSPPQQFPQLHLSNEQRMILASHLSDAIAKICSITYNDKNKFDAMQANAYEHGRMALVQALLNYDKEALETATTSPPPDKTMLLDEQASSPATTF